MQKRELTVETIQSSAMAMSILMEPSKHIPEMLLRNRRFASLLHLVRDAVAQDSRSRHAVLHSSLHAHSLDDSDGSSTGFSLEGYPSGDYNSHAQRDSHRGPLFSQPCLSMAPDHVSSHEKRALYSFVSDMKASLVDDDLMDGYDFHMATGALNEACDGTGSASPPSLTKGMQQTRAPAESACTRSANPEKMFASRILHPAAFLAPVAHCTYHDTPCLRSNLKQVSGCRGCKGPFMDTSAPHTACQSTEPQYLRFMEGYPARIPAIIEGEGCRSWLSPLRAGPGLGLGDGLAAKPVSFSDHLSHVGQAVENKDRLITSEVSEMRPVSSRSQENVGMFGATGKICRPLDAAESCWTSSCCSSPSMVLNAAVYAFCASHGLASEASPGDSVLEVANLPARLSAANLEGHRISEKKTCSSSGIAAEQKGTSVDTVAPRTPAQRRPILPPSSAIPGCKSPEPAAHSLAPEASVGGTWCLPGPHHHTVFSEYAPTGTADADNERYTHVLIGCYIAGNIRLTSQTIPVWKHVQWHPQLWKQQTKGLFIQHPQLIPVQMKSQDLVMTPKMYHGLEPPPRCRDRRICRFTHPLGPKHEVWRVAALHMKALMQLICGQSCIPRHTTFSGHLSRSLRAMSLPCQRSSVVTSCRILH